MTRKLVYISGPFTAHSRDLVRANIDKAVEYGHLVRQLGATPLVPHIAVVPPKDLNAEDAWGIAMRDCLRFLFPCDGCFMLPGWDRSRGAKIELVQAEEWNIPVFHSLEELDAWLKGVA